MSLDIDLLNPIETEQECIHCGSVKRVNETIYSANITHNLTTMADNAGLYLALWKPEVLELKTAKDLIPFLEDGINRLKQDPEKYKVFNPKNGWGNYENLLYFSVNLLIACKENPEAIISVSR